MNQVEELVRGTVVEDEVGGDPGAQCPEEWEGLRGAGHDAEAARDLLQRGRARARGALVEVHVRGAVLADEDGAHVADDPVVLGRRNLVGVEESPRVDVGGEAGRHGADAEECDVCAVDRVEDRLDGAFAPERLFGVRVVEERGHGEVDDAPADGLCGASDDGLGVGHARLGGGGRSVELDDGGTRKRHVGHGPRHFCGGVSPGDAEGNAGEEHVDEVFRSDERNVVQAVDLGVYVVDGNDGDLDAEEVGNLSREGALEAGGCRHRDAHQADLPRVGEKSRDRGA